MASKGSQLKGIAILAIVGMLILAVPSLVVAVLRRYWWSKLGAVGRSQSSLGWLFANRVAAAAEYLWMEGSPANAISLLTTGRVNQRGDGSNRGAKQAIQDAENEGSELVAIGADGQRLIVPGGASSYLNWLEQVTFGGVAPNAPACASLAKTLHEFELESFQRELNGKSPNRKKRRRGIRAKLAECLSGQNVANPWIDALVEWGKAAAEIAITVRGKKGDEKETGADTTAAATA